MTNPNLFIWTSDWHVASNDTEQGFATYPTDAAAVTAHIASLDPAGVIDTGDCKDDYGPASFDEHDQYISKVRSSMPWATVNPGISADLPILPGNHDELNDYSEVGAEDFSLFDDKFWGAPYHWTCDWAAPQVRFIAFHARIVHVGDVTPEPGFFVVEQAERDWLQDELEALPDGWQAIVCSHPALNPASGNNIEHRWPAGGGAQTQTILRNHSGRVAAYLNGHRHANMNTSVLDGITHFNGPGMAYTLGNSYGGFVLIQYDSAARTLTFGFLKGPPSSYPPMVGYTPVVIQLPPIAVEPPEPTPSEQAVAELKLTTVGYKNKHWTTPPVGTHWRNALDLLEV